MQEAHGIGDGPGAGYAPRHELGVPDARWHSMSLTGGGTYGAPDGGTLERERLWPQGQALLTPLASGDGIWTDVAVGGRALNTPKPPAVAGLHRHEPRRGSASLPQRTAGGEADAGDRYGDNYIDMDGTAHAPDGQASRAELGRSHQAELDILRGTVELLRKELEAVNRGDQARTHGPSPCESNLNQAGQPPGPTTFTTSAAGSTSGRTRCPRRRFSDFCATLVRRVRR